MFRHAHGRRGPLLPTPPPPPPAAAGGGRGGLWPRATPANLIRVRTGGKPHPPPTVDVHAER